MSGNQLGLLAFAGALLYLIFFAPKVKAEEPVANGQALQPGALDPAALTMASIPLEIEASLLL